MDGRAGVGVMLMLDKLAGGVDGFVEEVICGVVMLLDDEWRNGDKSRY